MKIEPGSEFYTDDGKLVRVTAIHQDRALCRQEGQSLPYMLTLTQIHATMHPKPEALPPGARWSRREDDTMLTLWGRHVGVSTMAKILGRTVNATFNRLARLRREFGLDGETIDG